MGLPSEEVDEERGGCKAASLFLFSFTSEPFCFKSLSRIKIEDVGNVLHHFGAFIGPGCKMQLAAGFPASK